MAKEALSSSEKRSVQLRNLIVPNWLWQLTWLRHLPRYYRSILWSECNRPGWRVVLDLLYIFFKLRIVPEHYGPCRLWERPRSEWALYYGTPYTPIQRGRLAKRVYPFEYQVLFNDKVLAAQLCKGLNVAQPTIFGILEPGDAFREKLAGFLNTDHQRRLMLKPVFGRSGIGIVVAERTDSGIVIHTSSSTIPLTDFQLEWPTFMQEVIQQDPRMASIWNSSVNTLRVVTLQTPSGEVTLVGAAMRMGVGKSFVDNWSAGGVAVGVDPQTGRLRKYGSDMTGKLYTQHPSSQVTFEGFQIPQWQAILETAFTIQREIPFSRVLGCDICLNQDGKPVLIELNGLPDFGLMEQLNHPLLSDPQILKIFAEYDLLVSRSQRKLIARSF